MKKFLADSRIGGNRFSSAFAKGRQKGRYFVRYKPSDLAGSLMVGEVILKVVWVNFSDSKKCPNLILGDGLLFTLASRGTSR